MACQINYLHHVIPIIFQIQKRKSRARFYAWLTYLALWQIAILKRDEHFRVDCQGGMIFILQQDQGVID